MSYPTLSPTFKPVSSVSGVIVPQNVPPDVPTQPITIHSPSPQMAETSENSYATARSQPSFISPNLPTPVSNRSVASSRTTSPIGAHTERSTSSMSSFTPAVIGPQSPSPTYASPRFTSVETLSDGGRSDGRHSRLDVVSIPSSQINSPFSDIHSVHTANVDGPSPLLLSPTSVISDFEMPDSDFGMLSPSLRSGMFSPSLIHEEDPFEVGSNNGSDGLSSWASVGRRTPEP